MVVIFVKDELVYVFPPEVTEKVSPERNPAKSEGEPVNPVIAVSTVTAGV